MWAECRLIEAAGGLLAVDEARGGGAWLLEEEDAEEQDWLVVKEKESTAGCRDKR